jgi:uncharacterized protein (TIGR03067 family)
MIARSFWFVTLGLLAMGADPQGETKPRSELDKLQGTWNVVALEIDGTKMEEKGLQGSKIIVKDSSFTTIAMGVMYKGTVKVNSASKPKTLDLMFTEGTIKGTTSLAIYDLDGDTWKICLTVNGTDRPKEFATTAGSGLALEMLKRDGGDKGQDAAKKELARLEGEWSMVLGEIGGQPLPEAYVKGAKRMAKGNEITVIIGGQMFFKATITVDPSKQPRTIDYAMTDGPSKGKTQYGIYQFDGDNLRFCFAAPGKERPTTFATKAGDDNTLSLWKKAK